MSHPSVVTVHASVAEGISNFYIDAMPSLIECSDISFPKIYVCQTSHHSLAKVKRYYPEMSMELLKSLYFKNASMNFPTWVDDIDLKNFFMLTRPAFELVTCIYDNQDCHGDWRLESTINGYCLTYNPIQTTGQETSVTLWLYFSL